MRRCRILFFMIIFSFQTAHGYYSTMDSGQIIEQGTFRSLLEAQAITESDSGMNLNAYLEHGLNDEMTVQGKFGVGEIDAFVSGFLKWMPFPDLDSQPAIGFKAGALLATYEDETELSLRLNPIVSKKFNTENAGLWIPYASLPIGIRSYDDDTDIPLQLAIGTEWRPVAYENIHFLAEAGFDLSDAFNYISFAASINFDSFDNIQWQ